MGQYYKAVLKINGGKEVFLTYIDGEFVGCKLMEHSYWDNSFVLAIASKFWRTKGQLAWVEIMLMKMISIGTQNLRMFGQT